MASVYDIVNSARQLLGAPYRQWQEGQPTPMWRMDGMGEPPPAWHLKNVGCSSAEVVNYALVSNGLPPGGGTGAFANYLVNTAAFDPSTPGEMGAIALRPYQSYEDQGSIALYLGPRQVITSTPSDGVTDQYTDEQMYSWRWQWPRYGFTIYGFLPGVYN